MPHRIVLINENPPRGNLNHATEISETVLSEASWDYRHGNKNVILLVLPESLEDNEFSTRLEETVRILENITNSLLVAAPSPFLQDQCGSEDDFLCCACDKINEFAKGGMSDRIIQTLRENALPYQEFLREHLQNDI